AGQASRGSFQWLAFWLIMAIASLLVRTSEIFWVVPLAVFGLWQGRASLSRQNIYGLIGLGLAGLVGATILGQLYSISSLSGYQAIGGSSSLTGLRSSLNFIFPFGLHPINALVNFWKYGLVLFW